MSTRFLDVVRTGRRSPVGAIAGALLLATLLAAPAGAVDITVTGVNQNGPPTAVDNFRWVVERDRTYHVPLVGGAPQADPGTLATSFHTSYMPVVAQGTGADTFAATVLPQNSVCRISGAACTKTPSDSCMTAPGSPDRCDLPFYYVSVLPASGYSIGGAAIAPGQTSVTVFVNEQPIPTAQIVVQVCEDTNPINNVCDPTELVAGGLPDFKIVVEDGGGRYGASAGLQSYDVFGNPLGTTYDANGNVLQLGSGIDTDAEGMAYVKPLAPGKYGIIVVPPTPGWVQTSTIEGKRVIDAWVKANEPPYFAEFGPPGPHVFVGFVPDTFDQLNTLPGGPRSNPITGQVVNNHLSRPPDYAMYSGSPFPHTTCWVGLNANAGVGPGLYVTECGEDGHFTIPGLPTGDYQLVVWDNNLDLVFAARNIRVDATLACNGVASCDLGLVPVNQWFGRMEHWVFNDLNEDGIRQCVTEACDNPALGDEPGIPEQNVNLRWRDGTVNQAMATDLTGFVPFDEVFPFFSWQVAEVDFARYKATGATIWVDNGGPTDPFVLGGNANPQDQTNPDDPGCSPLDGCFETALNRTEAGVVLTQGYQSFLGQTSFIEWGKQAYGPGENGGISGVVFYSVTRGEDDPRYGAAEVWEPGIPGVTVNLYTETGAPVATTTTDSWDESVPTGCKWGNDAVGPFLFDHDRDPGTVLIPTDCYDGIRNWNQARPAVFDGGYAFDGLAAGRYVVEVVPPFGYQIVRSQDRNVDFGDPYQLSGLLLPPECVGTPYQVPAYLSLNDLPGVNPSEKVGAPLAGQSLPDCNQKLVNLSNGANAAADFFLFTQTPIAAHAIGFILDDTANEFDPNSPQFGEKYAPPFLPISIRDWTGREIGRTLSDAFGRYNFLAPSTFTANLPQPSGMSPNMLTTCMNAKYGTAADGAVFADPLHDPRYSQFCYTFQYMPGATVYLDTPVVPVSAFTGPDQFPLDCEYMEGTPRIYSVDNGSNQGPWLLSAGTLYIDSMGLVDVPNPAYPGYGPNKTVSRDFGFGLGGTVTLTSSSGVVTNLSTTWGDDLITATVPTLAPGAYQLTVERGDTGLATTNAVTVHVGGSAPTVVVQGIGAIQAAVDSAVAGGLITVAPGVYQENVILWKAVRLQGWGEGSVIDAVKLRPESLQEWRDKVAMLVQGGDVDLVPGQEAAFGGIEPAALFTEEGAGVFVIAQAGNTAWANARVDGFTIEGADTGGGVIVNGYANGLSIANNRVANNSGFYAGGIRVGHPSLTNETACLPNVDLCYTDAQNDNVKIHHNYVSQNGGIQGAGGGVSICPGADNYRFTNNFVCGNFNLEQGGGVAHYGLSQNGLIQSNTIIFNESFNQGPGGRFDGGGLLIAGQPALPGQAATPGAGDVVIDSNLIQGNAAQTGDGGGISLLRVNGLDVAGSNSNNVNNAVYHNVKIVNNMIVNNVAGSAGGGVSIFDATNVDMYHNTIAHNDSTATLGDLYNPAAGVSAGQLGAGIAARPHSADLVTAINGRWADYPNTNVAVNQRQLDLRGDIIWQNRSFLFKGAGGAPGAGQDPTAFGLCPDVENLLPAGFCDSTLGSWQGNTAFYSNLAVLGRPAAPFGCNPAGSCTDLDPLVVTSYFNGGREPSQAQPEASILATAAFDEGGNFIRVRFGPISQVSCTVAIDPISATCPGDWVLTGDYHLSTAGGPAYNRIQRLDNFDFDRGPRPAAAGQADLGADEFGASALKGLPEGGAVEFDEPTAEIVAE